MLDSEKWNEAKIKTAFDFSRKQLLFVLIIENVHEVKYMDNIIDDVSIPVAEVVDNIQKC